MQLSNRETADAAQIPGALLAASIKVDRDEETTGFESPNNNLSRPLVDKLKP